MVRDGKKTAGRQGVQSIQPTLTGMEWDTAPSTGRKDNEDMVWHIVKMGFDHPLTEDELLALGVASGKAPEWDRERYSETFENVEMELE